MDRRRDVTWPQFLLAHCNIGRSRSYELIAIADGRKTLEEIREDQRRRSADHDERNRFAREKTSVVNGQSAQKTQQNQSSTPENTDPVDYARRQAERERAAIVARQGSPTRNP